jgi:phenylacetate-CoA ligase
MAVIGNFDNVLSFIQTNLDKPLIKWVLKKNNLSEINSYEDFLKIKPLQKFELSSYQNENPPFNGLIDINSISKMFQSPGPIYNVKGKDFTHYRFYKALEDAGFNSNDIVLNTFSYHISPAGEMFDDGLKKIGAKIIPLGPSSSEQAAEFVENMGATAFIGTKTFLLKILAHLKNSKIKKAYLIAEKLTEEDRKMFKDQFNIYTFQGYGTAEFGLIASEDSTLQGMKVDTDAIFLEIVKPGTGDLANLGEIGEVVITFLNDITPFIRLSTGDLSKINEKQPKYLEGIFGRADSSIKIKGVFIHFWQFEEFCSQLNANFNLIATTDENNSDCLDLVSSKDFNKEDLRNIFKNKFKLNLRNISIDKDLDCNKIIERRTHLSKK